MRPGEVWTAMVDRMCDSEEAAARLRAERASRSVLPIDGDACDIARAVAFLATDQARWITGQTLSVDGLAPLFPPNPQCRSHHRHAKAPRYCTHSRRCRNAPEPCPIQQRRRAACGEIGGQS